MDWDSAKLLKSCPYKKNPGNEIFQIKVLIHILRDKEAIIYMLNVTVFCIRFRDYLTVAKCIIKFIEEIIEKRLFLLILNFIIIIYK